MKLAVPTLPLFNQSKIRLRENSFDKEENCLKVPSVNDYDDVEACKNCKSSDKIPQVGIPLDHMQKFGTSLKLGLPFFQNCTERTDRHIL